MGIITYWVTKALNHGNKDYVVGQSIELTDKQAAYWLADESLSKEPPKLAEKPTKQLTVKKQKGSEHEHD